MVNSSKIVKVVDVQVLATHTLQEHHVRNIRPGHCFKKLEFQVNQIWLIRICKYKYIVGDNIFGFSYKD